MRNFKKYTVILFLIVSFCSCTTYYYSTVDTTQWENFKNDDGDFMFENDTVSIVYCFYGENLPISITVYNKLDQPLVLDWQQSALIVEDAASSYFNRTVPIRGEINSSTYRYRDYLYPGTGYSDTHGEFSGRLVFPEGTAFIPPKSKISTTPITLANFVFDGIPKEAYTETKFSTKNSGMKKVRIMNFIEEDTPLRFRSYLTLYTISANGNRDRSMAFEQRFYISQLMKAGSISPSEILASEQQRGDFFYVRQEKGHTFGIVAGIVALGVAGIALDAAVDH